MYIQVLWHEVNDMYRYKANGTGKLHCTGNQPGYLQPFMYKPYCPKQAHNSVKVLISQLWQFCGHSISDRMMSSRTILKVTGISSTKHNLQKVHLLTLCTFLGLLHVFTGIWIRLMLTICGSFAFSLLHGFNYHQFAYQALGRQWADRILGHATIWLVHVQSKLEKPKHREQCYQTDFA